jgi:pimeloyl-ACP methyl ester carboxylesterase
VHENAAVATYVDAETRVLRATNGVEYAYRATGAADATPLVTLQHFRGSLDNWDPALIDALARGRRVITFDNRGVAASSGKTPSTIAQMALDAIDFIDGLEVGEVDLLGFSIGSFVAQEIALVRPSAVRKVVLASSAPQGASGMHGWAPDVIDAVGKPETPAADYLRVFFTGSEAGRAAGQQVAGRVFGARTVDRDATTGWQTRLAQYDAVCTWGQPNHSLLERVSAIDKPVFVANGDSDPMILPRYSYLLAGLIPERVSRSTRTQRTASSSNTTPNSPPTSRPSWPPYERCSAGGAAQMRPVRARPAAVAVGRVGRAVARAECGAGLALVDAARRGQAQVAAYEHGAARQGGDLRRRNRLLTRRRRDRVGSQSPRRAAGHHAHDVLGVGAVGEDPRPPIRVEDGREAAHALGGVAAAHRVEGHAHGVAPVALARGHGFRHQATPAASTVRVSVQST